MRHLLLLPGIFLLITACAPQPVTVTREPVTLRVVAADSCEPFLRDAVSGYQASRPWVTVEAQVFDTAVAEQVLREDGAHVGLLSWVFEEDEGRERSLWTEGIARDGVAVVVHPGSPLVEIGVAQLREIFLGRLQEWDGVVLTVVSREEGSGTRAAFESLVLGGEGTTLNAVVMPSNESMIEYVADTPGAIGYVSTQWLDAGVQVLEVEGVLPTEQTIADGSYPLWRQLYLASNGEPAGEAREFSQWLLSGGGGQSGGAGGG
ncbi:MAG: substrate-binding domain-containing protein [Chloroflexota bacterium]|nr:substrate-binding domain-containing protein [Chloroflexota bacterium]